jgi:hypothetical protein
MWRVMTLTVALHTYVSSRSETKRAGSGKEVLCSILHLEFLCRSYEFVFGIVEMGSGRKSLSK